MTKTKCLNRTGKVVRIDLHPTKAQCFNGETFRSRLKKALKSRFTPINRGA